MHSEETLPERVINANYILHTPICSHATHFPPPFVLLEQCRWEKAGSAIQKKVLTLSLVVVLLFKSQGCQAVYLNRAGLASASFHESAAKLSKMKEKEKICSSQAWNRYTGWKQKCKINSQHLYSKEPPQMPEYHATISIEICNTIYYLCSTLCF